MRVLRFCKCDKYTFNSLEKKQILFSKPLYFNDPFDGKAVNFFSFKSFEKTYERLINYLQKSSKKSELTSFVPKMFSEKRYDILYESIWNPEKIKAFSDVFIAYNLLELISIVETNVFCTSKKEKMIEPGEKYFTNNALLLFSHYSNSHSGIVLEYDFDSIQEFRPVPIDYKETYSPSAIDDDLTNEILNGKCKMLFETKSIVWEYESEVRFFHKNPIVTFEENLPLKNIYFGALCSEENKSIIKEIIKKSHDASIGLYQAKQKMNDFKLEIVQI